MTNIQIDAQPVFSNYLYVCQMPTIVDIEAVKKECKKGSSVSNRGGWQSEKYNSGSLPASLLGLIQDTTGVVAQVYAHMGLKKHPELSNCWINVCGNSAYNTRHRHPRSYFSAVYYLAVPEGSAGLLFHRPDMLSDYFPDRDSNDSNAVVVELDPKEKDLVVFPSYLDHSVEVSGFIEGERIAVAMNFR